MAKKVETSKGTRNALAAASDGPAGEILLYQTEDGRTRVEYRSERDHEALTAIYQEAAQDPLFQADNEAVLRDFAALDAEADPSDPNDLHTAAVALE